MELENLFLKETSFDSITDNYLSLPEAPEDWDYFITEQIMSKLNIKGDLSVTIEYDAHKDDKKGYAVGTATVSDGTKKRIGIPIIIRSFKLAPLDIMIFNDKDILPFDLRRIEKEFFKSQTFDKAVKKGKRDGATRQDISPAHLERTASRHSILEKIADTISPKDHIQFCKNLKAHPEYLRGFEKNGQEDLIKALIRLKPVLTKDIVKEASSLKNVKVVYIKKVANDQFDLLVNPISEFNPKLVSLNKKEDAEEFISRVVPTKLKVFNAEINNVGETAIIKDDKTAPGTYGDTEARIFLEDEIVYNAVSADKYKAYVLKDLAGVAVTGKVIPHVIDYDQKDIRGLKIFVGKGISSIQQDFAGQEAVGDYELKDCELVSGKFGTFVYENEGKALATLPFTIKSVAQRGHNIYITATTMWEQPVAFEIWLHGDGSLGREFGTKLQRIADMTPKTREKGFDVISADTKTYSIPDTFKFIELPNIKELHKTVDDFEKRASISKLEGEPLEVLWHGGTFSMNHSNMHKYAQCINIDPTLMSRGEVKFMLGAFGTTNKEANHIIKHAKENYKSIVHGIQFPMTYEEKHKHAIYKVSQLLPMVNTLKQDTVKVASALKNTEAVDSVLSLNFINPENISIFARSIPGLEQCSQVLAKILLGARLGMEQVPEAAAQSAMKNILDVIKGLKELSTLLK